MSHCWLIPQQGYDLRSTLDRSSNTRTITTQRIYMYCCMCVFPSICYSSTAVSAVLCCTAVSKKDDDMTCRTREGNTPNKPIGPCLSSTPLSRTHASIYCYSSNPPPPVLTKGVIEVAVPTLALERIATIVVVPSPPPTAHPGGRLGHHPTTRHHARSPATTAAASSSSRGSSPPRSSTAAVGAGHPSSVAAAIGAATSACTGSIDRPACRVAVPAILSVAINAESAGHWPASTHHDCFCCVLRHVCVFGSLCVRLISLLPRSR